MTPSPGASVCLYNAMRDAEKVGEFFSPTEYKFDKERMLAELCAKEQIAETDVSLKYTYPS